MNSEDVEYISPASLKAAIAALQEKPGARLIAGGTDLMVAMRSGRCARPTRLVDLSRVRELDGIQESDGWLRIGAVTKIDDLLRHPAILARFHALIDAGRLLGGWQTQNMATLAGNLCNASPAAEMAGPLLVLEAEVEICGPNGERRIPLQQFWLGPGQTVLGAAEIVTAVMIPSPRGASAYKRIDIRHSVDIALVNCSACLEMKTDQIQQAWLALGAVAPTTIRVPTAETFLRGKTLSEETLDQAAELATQAASPISDVRASKEYRLAMVAVLVRRVLLAAAARGIQ